MPEHVKNQLISLGVGAVIFLTGFCAMLFVVDPYKASLPLIILFYLLLVAAMFCLFSLVFFGIRAGSKQVLHYERLKIARREAFLLAILAAGSLFLLSKNLLYWWVEIIFIVLIVLIEMFFLI